jgi:hypothetical protein
MLCLTNVTAEPVALPGVSGHDVVTDRWVDDLVLPPWGHAWLRHTSAPQPAGPPVLDQARHSAA